MLPQRKINPNAVDKTPNKDTLQLSTKKVLIGAIIAKIGVVLGVTLLVLKGKKPPKNIINQAEQTITHPATIPKMEMTDDAKVIYDNIASILHKKPSSTTPEIIEKNLAPKQKTGSWDSMDMKEYYTQLEKETAEMEGKRVYDNVASILHKKQTITPEIIDKNLAPKPKIGAWNSWDMNEYYRLLEIRPEYEKLNIVELGEKYAELLKLEKRDFPMERLISDIVYSRMPARLKALNITAEKSINTPIASQLSPEELKAISKFVDYGVSEELRRGQELKCTRILDSLVERSEPLKQEAYVYRGITGWDRETSEFMRTIKEVAVITDKAFVSTAKTPDVQFQQFLSYGGDTMALRIKLPKGTKGINANWSEFILPRNSQIRVVSIDRELGIAECEYILPLNK